jgi:hypothetical protein
MCVCVCKAYKCVFVCARACVRVRITHPILYLLLCARPCSFPQRFHGGPFAGSFSLALCIGITTSFCSCARASGAASLQLSERRRWVASKTCVVLRHAIACPIKLGGFRETSVVDAMVSHVPGLELAACSGANNTAGPILLACHAAFCVLLALTGVLFLLSIAVVGGGIAAPVRAVRAAIVGQVLAHAATATSKGRIVHVCVTTSV